MAEACLGDGEYAARVVRRRTLLGPARPLGELPTLEGASWARAPQTTTDASVTVALGAEGCVETLNLVDPWRDELELYRASGMSDDLVWAGPIIDLSADPNGGTATVMAKDPSAWFAKRVLLTDFIHEDVDLATIVAEYLAYAFATDDPGISVETTPTGILGTRTVAATDLKRLDTELAELARTGVDWTVTGRTFWIGGVEVAGRTVVLPTRLVDQAFAVPPTVRLSGADMVNEAHVRGNGVQGAYGGPDPQDGVLLQDVRDEQSIEDQASADASAATWWDRGHEPAYYVEGENQLAPDAPVEVQTLIPGVLVPVDLDGGGVLPYQGRLRLESLSGNYSADGEALTVALQPIGTVTPAEAA